MAFKKLIGDLSLLSLLCFGIIFNDNDRRQHEDFFDGNEVVVPGDDILLQYRQYRPEVHPLSKPSDFDEPDYIQDLLRPLTDVENIGSMQQRLHDFVLVGGPVLTENRPLPSPFTRPQFQDLFEDLPTFDAERRESEGDSIFDDDEKSEITANVVAIPQQQVEPPHLSKEEAFRLELEYLLQPDILNAYDSNNNVQTDVLPEVQHQTTLHHADTDLEAINNNFENDLDAFSVAASQPSEQVPFLDADTHLFDELDYLEASISDAYLPAKTTLPTEKDNIEQAIGVGYPEIGATASNFYVKDDSLYDNQAIYDNNNHIRHTSSGDHLYQDSFAPGNVIYDDSTTGDHQNLDINTPPYIYQQSDELMLPSLYENVNAAGNDNDLRYHQAEQPVRREETETALEESRLGDIDVLASELDFGDLIGVLGANEMGVSGSQTSDMLSSTMDTASQTSDHAEDSAAVHSIQEDSYDDAATNHALMDHDYIRSPSEAGTVRMPSEYEALVNEVSNDSPISGGFSAKSGAPKVRMAELSANELRELFRLRNEAGLKVGTPKLNDESIIRRHGIPYSIEEISLASFKQFVKMQQNEDLNSEQRSVMRAIRRRAKNKVAALNSRQRKLTDVSSLADDIDQLRLQTERLRERRQRLLERRSQLRQQYEDLREGRVSSSTSSTTSGTSSSSVTSGGSMESGASSSHFDSLHWSADHLGATVAQSSDNNDASFHQHTHNQHLTQPTRAPGHSRTDSVTLVINGNNNQQISFTQSPRNGYADGFSTSRQGLGSLGNVAPTRYSQYSSKRHK